MLKRWTLKNGLELEALDLSENYWADFWNLRIQIVGRVKVDPSLIPFEDPLAEEALKALGDEVTYLREITKVGVREEELQQQRRKVLLTFEQNALPYLQHPDFPRRFLLRRFEETLKKMKIEKMRRDQGEEADEV